MSSRLPTHKPLVALTKRHEVAPRSNSTRRGYGYRWQQERKAHLRLYPLCVMCQAIGRVTEATVVDHIIPHRGDPALFWNTDNWQSLCAPHHDSDKQMAEKSGRVRKEFDAEGRVIW